jgi:hypothetical protein
MAARDLREFLLLTKEEHDWDRYGIRLDLSACTLPEELWKNVQTGQDKARARWAGPSYGPTRDPAYLFALNWCNGFLSPDGFYYPNPNGASHWSTAASLCEALGFNALFSDGESCLIDRLGWVKFEGYEKRDLDMDFCRWLRKPTRSQQQFLDKLLVEARKDKRAISSTVERWILERADHTRSAS